MRKAAIRTRKPPTERTAEILAAAVKCAEQKGLTALTRDDVAFVANVSPALVSARIGSMEKLRDDVVRVAVREKILPIIAQGLAIGHARARRAPVDLRQRAMKSMA